MTSNPLRSARAVAHRLGPWHLFQTAAIVAACVFAYNGARILNNSPRSADLFLANFDSAAVWLGLALLALVFAAWQPSRPKLESVRHAIVKIWRDHYIEALLFGGIIAFGIFMRFFHFNGTLPPEIGLCCEEHINGGAAYDALEGDRPLLFPLVRWTSALGFLVFGETTLGLRFFFPIIGVATLIVFYFLLRQLVSVQSALFGLALFAIAWWPALRSRQTSEGTIYVVLFAFFIVRGLKTKSPLMFLGAGIVAGLMSYEYEAFRVVPIIAVGTLGIAASRIVLLDGKLTEARARLLELVRVAWRPALVFLLAAGIVLVPMIVGTSQDKDLYLTSVHRNENAREGSRLADEWQDQLKWVSTMFLPFGPLDYPVSPPREVEGIRLFDPVTAVLAVAGMAAGALFFLRGYRFWFVSWVVLVLAGGALLLGEFAPWSFFGVVPILLALAAYFIDDVESFLKRVFGSLATRSFTLVLIALVAFSFWWNADTLFNDVEGSREVQRVYGGEISFVYAMCDYLRDRGDDNYAIAYSNAIRVDGFAAPRDTADEQRRAWSDFIWACHDLQGAALPAAQEAWPLRGVPDGPATLLFADPIGSADELVEELNRAYPGLGEPDERFTGPAGTYEFLAYDFDTGDTLNKQGLWAVYVKRALRGEFASQLDSFADDVLQNAPFKPPYRVSWTGVIYVDDGGPATLKVAGGLPAEVLVDGEEGVVELVQGWHPVVVRLDVDEQDLVIALEWEDASGSRTAVRAADLFPLAQLDGWRHTRSMGLPDNPSQIVSQRLDFSPHMALASVLRESTPTREQFVTEERWDGVLQLAEPTNLSFSTEFRAGTVMLLIDGEEVASGQHAAQRTTTLQANIDLAAGRHTIQLIQTIAREVTWSGATLSIVASDGSSPVVTPY